MQVQCYKGDPYSALSMDEIGAVTRNASVPIEANGPTKVVMNIPGGWSDANDFECIYGFQQWVQGKLIGGQQLDTPIPEENRVTWKNRGNFSFGAWDNLGEVNYGENIVEGVNQFGSIYSDQEPGVVLNPSDAPLKPANYSDVRQDLKDMETQHYINENPFKQFPSPSPLEPGKDRNPVPDDSS